jgi:flagellar hook-basal body complex protein FliE
MTISQFAIVAATVLGGQLGADVLRWLRSRKGEAAKAAREQKHDEEVGKQAELNHAELLAAAQHTAQETAVNTTKDALTDVRRECKECKEELRGLRDITGKLIDALEELMAQDTPQSRADARATIRLARRAM